ncbi:EcoAI/FtnUII family type I restriction enzme subunit R [Bacterioplanoides pacificum]|uniref:EcoAI/FtnUII family type I restriction enzme subunit R n=1 Tax=Bacterioplanoides pacificum TaxID=1171596 RepID=A0ABV7VSM8_9GAMM
MDKRSLTETDIRTKYITPAIISAGWDIQTQVYEEFSVSDGRIVVRGRMHSRQAPRRADYVLCYQKAKPIAVIEAKDNKHRVGDGMQQAMDYAEKLDVPFAISSNGDSFLFRDPHGLIYPQVETEIALSELPGPDTLWAAYCRWKDIPDGQAAMSQPYHEAANDRTPRYYQMVAINRTIEAVAKGQDRILLVMATGTGKTYTAFQIIWRLWKSKQKKRILFLADRNILVDQTMNNDFKPFAGAMAKLSPRGGGMERNGKKLDIELAVKKDKDRVNKVDTSYEIYLGLYQALSGTEEERNVYKQFSPDFFDLIVIDECHRGSAAEDSAWRAILEYFDSATHIGLTATPKETKEVSNIHYFGEPVYTYSLKQGIDDGYLAPYKVIRVDFDKDLQGWRPNKGQKDKSGQLIDDRIYNQRDFDKNIVMDQRTLLVAQTITEYMRKTDPMQKTIVFCENIDHAERMRQLLVNLNPEQVAKNRKYVMRITGDDKEGKAELDHFIDPEEPYPVIACTSKLMTTGVDAKTCKLVVLDQRIQSMTEFKQIIGRGTRIDEAYGKQWFTILDFKKATELFADEKFDGDPEQIYVPSDNDDILPPDPTNENGTEQPTGIKEPEGEYGTSSGNSGADTGTGPWEPGDEPREPKKKFRIGDVEFSIIDQRIQHLDSDGKLITENLTDFTRKSVQGHYATLSDFLKRWNEAERKQAVIDELTAQGVSWDDLIDDLKGKLGDEPDPFDVITHIVYDQPALTRKQRAVQAKRRRNIFDRYSKQAQTVLDTLLDKYADTGVQSIEDIKILQLPPFDKLGTGMELINAFGDKSGYEQALRELENTLYNDEAG